jgi:hypothetical protein
MRKEQEITSKSADLWPQQILIPEEVSGKAVPPIE